MNQIQKTLLVVGTVLFGVAGLGGLASCSKVRQDSSFHQKLPDRAQIESSLDWHFNQCRNACFHDTMTVNFGADLATYMYIELPEEELQALLDNSDKLADYDQLKVNKTNLEFMMKTGAKLTGWNVEYLQNAVCGTISWCTHHEGPDCVLYGSSTVAVAPIGESWFAVYIAFDQEGAPSPKYFMNRQWKESK